MKRIRPQSKGEEIPYLRDLATFYEHVKIVQLIHLGGFTFSGRGREYGLGFLC
jgi:hypothetical protein